MATKGKKNMEPLSPVTEIEPEARKMMLKKALNDISKRYGEGSIMRLGEAKQMEVEGIPTGSLGLDLALGVGGYYGLAACSVICFQGIPAACLFPFHDAVFVLLPGSQACDL